MAPRGGRGEVSILRSTIDTNESAFPPAILKLDGSGNGGKERIVAADTHIATRLEACSALADEDGASGDELPAEPLDSQSLRRRIATIS